MVLHLLLIIFAIASSTQGSAHNNLVYEQGYAVTTIFDGNKLSLNPHSLLHRSRSRDLIILDSLNSVFYSVPFPIPQENVAIKRFSGNGVTGFSDGDLVSAMFNKPRSFAVDFKGNIYVAEKYNHAIRKISSSGVTTIAGGYTQKSGNIDGPAQNASFSDDFELVFVPEVCSLLISDRGNKLIRQIELKPDDCARGSQSGLGAASVWALGLGVSCLIGLLVGFIARPYVIPHTGRVQRSQFQQDMEALPNPAGETSIDTLLRHQKRNC